MSMITTKKAELKAKAQQAVETKSSTKSSNVINTDTADKTTASESSLVVQSKEEDEGEDSSLWRDLLYSSPTWVFSMIMHIAIVLGMSLYVTKELSKTGTALTTVTMEDAVEVETEFQTDIVLPKLEEWPETPPAPSTTASTVDTSPAPVVMENTIATDVGEIDRSLLDFGSDPSNGVIDVGALKGSGGTGVGFGKGDSDAMGTATFFGVPSKGKIFCFVVDNSNSMKGEKIKAAKQELMLAIDKLKPHQSFYVVFFSDKAYPLFFPNTAPDHVPAVSQTKQLLAEWLPKTGLHLKTRGEGAMKIALTLQPDVIYILGDGVFTDNTVAALLAHEDSKLKINTIGFNMTEGSKAAKDFESIAKKFSDRPIIAASPKNNEDVKS